MKTGPLIVIEGIDRIGKNTQAELLASALMDRGVSCEVFSTPQYADDVNGLIESFLKQKATVSRVIPGDVGFKNDNSLVLECLQICNRYSVTDDVREALVAGKVAIVVRWWQSALLYGRSDGLDAKWIERMCSSLPHADLSILLSVDPQQVRSRLCRRDKYEGDAERQLGLAQDYLDLWRGMAESDPLGWKVVDGSGSVADVAGRVSSEVENFLNSWRGR